MSKITITMLFPIILISLDIGATVAYLMTGDIRRCIYWVAAAILTICVTI
jgi:hypothetical protein